MLTFVALAALAGLTAGAGVTWRRVHKAVRQIERIVVPDRAKIRSGSPVARLEACAAVLGSRGDVIDRRLGQRHAVSGLPTREPLLHQMAQDGSGTLGLLSCRDFDRLAAFDPALAERVMLMLVDRLTRMVNRRLIAHVDRAQLALWFEPGVAPAVATAELQAIAYALGDRIVDGARDIFPDIGVLHASFPDEGATPQLLLSRGLAALSLGQSRMGPAGATVTDGVDAARERYLMEQDLRQAIDRGEFTMCFQPLVDASEGRVCGAEALLRWNHPVHGTVSPARFVPVVEAMGLADEVGLWTLNTACREARGWQRAGMAALRVAVNVSAHQLGRADMRLLIERTLERHALPPSGLEIELTETVAAADTDRAAMLFEGLRAIGVRIAIDDFGTGFSSFSALRRLTFDKIKIDREFVTAVDARPDSQAICQSVIALGRGLGIRVLAEGVEREEEYRWLHRHGCTHFQGFYFAPPLSSADFIRFVDDGDGLARLLGTDPRHDRNRIAQRLSA